MSIRRVQAVTSGRSRWRKRLKTRATTRFLREEIRVIRGVRGTARGRGWSLSDEAQSLMGLRAIAEEELIGSKLGARHTSATVGLRLTGAVF
jgi:hypothetical protein